MCLSCLAVCPCLAIPKLLLFLWGFWKVTVWPDLPLGELLFSLSRCFLGQLFIAKICIQVVNEKHQILSNGEIRTLSNWRDMLARSTWGMPVFPLACLPCKALCPSDICGSINKLQWFLLLIQSLAAGLLSRSFEVVTPVAACAWIAVCLSALRDSIRMSCGPQEFPTWGSCKTCAEVHPQGLLRKENSVWCPLFSFKWAVSSFS